MSDPADERASDDQPQTRAEARRAMDGVGFQEHVREARSDFEQQIGKARADFEQANERINARTGRNLLMAILIGLALGAAVLGSLLFVKWLFILFALPVALLGVFEFCRALQAHGRRVDVIPQLVLGGVVVLAGFFVGHWTHWVITFTAVAALIVWRLLAQMAARDGRRYGEVVTDALVAGLLLLYVSFLASLLLVLLREDQGELWVLTMIAIAVASDTGAYASGLAFGSHPMAPRISPKKTWEGFAGAVVAAVAAGVLMGIFVLQVPFWVGLLFGVGVLISATIGDLGESMIKRDLGIKDMSSWLPGHGGVLDRLDSILPSTVVALAMYFLFFPLVSA
ncbi:phosphatidate cytidylyltransferase [Microbacterium invictum]|uniref:Phosphatidate cytidylyltransferase n=1 Tax=Microbacterium invictum TaxID=515415 RepID=A0AA40SMI0_9MICO|nr:MULTISPECIES: phosphatidate cytidylyltransferase [Microbacterium]MBB4138970.1 phosphatidate cytidylyltransferase [Microbacterium invictum]